MPGLAQKIRDAIAQYETLKKNYPIEGLTHVKQAILQDMNTLAISETQEFTDLMMQPESPLMPLLYDFFDTNSEAKAKFIETSTPEQFVFYVDFVCDNAIQRYRWHYQQKDWESMMNKLYELEQQYPNKNLSVEQRDIVLIEIGSTFSKSLCYHAVKDKIIPNIDALANKIKENIFALQNVNVRPGLLELILDNNFLEPKLKKQLIENLLSRGIKITSDATDPNEARLKLPSYKSENDTELWIENLYSFAFQHNPSIPIKVLESKLRDVIHSGSIGACRAIVAELKRQEVPLDAYKFMGIFPESGCIREGEIRGFVTYIQLCGKDINDVLEHCATEGPDKLFRILKHICFVSRYFDYEAQPTKGVMYYFAMHPEICAKSNELLEAYINPRYNYQSTSYCTDETYFKNGTPIKNLFVKDNSEVSPLDVAVQQKNVQFMLFVLRTINSTVKTDVHFRQQVINAICKLQQQGCDVSEVRNYAQERLKQHWRPNRWLTFENSLLLALNRQDESKRLSLVSFMPRFTM